jgi:hypothetical protein
LVKTWGADKIKFCEKCGEELDPECGPNTKYCAKCRAIVRKAQVKGYVKKHREMRGLPEDHKEQCRKAMRKYRERWGISNKNEQLGSGRLSPKRKSNFKDEQKIIEWELRRLGVR